MYPLRSAHAPPYPLIALLAGALALLALYRFLVRLRRDRVVADTPLARLRSAAQGYVKVTGRALPADPAPAAAPLSRAAVRVVGIRDRRGAARLARQHPLAHRRERRERRAVRAGGRRRQPLSGRSGVGRGHPHGAQRLVRLRVAAERAAARAHAARALRQLALYRAPARGRRRGLRHGRAALALRDRRRGRRDRGAAAQLEGEPGCAAGALRHQPRRPARRGRVGRGARGGGARVTGRDARRAHRARSASSPSRPTASRS